MVCEKCGSILPPRARTTECGVCSNKRRALERYYQKTRSELKAARDAAHIKKPCKCCGAFFIEKHKLQAYCSSKCKNRHKWKIKRAKESKPQRASVRLICCEHCGISFIRKSKSQRFCSVFCSVAHMKKEEAPSARPKDIGITLKKVYNRDNGKCHICGGKTNYEDYRNENGTFIAGKNYPSIDHINPIARGGSHTWDNVKLAHRYCNGVKRDCLEYETKDGQMAFAI